MTVGFDIDASSVLLTAAVLIGVGLAVCFFGWRLFQLYLGFIGFAVGLGLGIALTADAEPFAQLVVGVGIGLVFALIAYGLFVIGFVMAGALLGAAVALALLSALNAQASATVVLLVIGAVLGGGLAFLLTDFIIALSTAFTGAGQVIVGGMLLLFPDQVMQDEVTGRITFDLGDGVTLVALIAWLLLGVAGFGFQNRTRPRR